jgi:LmbE family N-acetylglucosaminyl deacetylase
MNRTGVGSMTIQGKLIMTLIAHPDDETQCSGTLAKLTKCGNQVVIVVATNGDKGTHDTSVKPGDISATRRTEMEKAAATIGATVEWLGFPDGTLSDATNLKEAVFRIIRKYRPDVLVTFDPFKKYDPHSDHITIGRIGFEAAYLADGCWYYPEHTMEGLEAYKPQEVYLFNPEVPNYTVDIHDSWQTKIQAADAHVSQFGGNFEQRMKDRLQRCGLSEDQLYSEVFYKVYDTDLNF